jgi:glycosyltransferase involved in cell wall biosynthesis
VLALFGMLLHLAFMDRTRDLEPLVSIAIAALNSADHIRDAVASVPPEISGGTVEIVLADGGSTDGTIEHAESTAARSHTSLRIIRDPDTGPYDGMDRAIANCRGRFVLILNSDDTLAPGALENLTSAAGTAAVVTGGALFSGIGSPRILSNHQWPMSERSILFGVPVMNARLFRRELFSTVGAFRRDVGLGADREFLLRILAAGVERHGIEQVVYHYREHRNSLTMNRTRASRVLLHQAHRELAKQCLSENLEPSQTARALKELKAAAQIKLLILSIGQQPMPVKETSLTHRIGDIFSSRSAALSGLASALAWRGYGSGW